MIQLLTKEGRVLYEVKKSDLFPNYKSVLQQAIRFQINLNGLYVESKDLSRIIWDKMNLDGVTFHNCKMINNRFSECTGKL